MEKYTRQAETLSRRLNAPDTPVLRSIMSGAFALLADVADAFLKQNGARVENVTKPYYFFEFGTPLYSTSTGSPLNHLEFQRGLVPWG